MSNPGETAPRSALDKPLGELTEEDIAQLTREDCRRFLKEKGMRRPSWNKSQAIQQVISLKALLESRPDSCDTATAGIHQKPPPPLPPPPPPPPSPPPLAAVVPSTRTEVCGSDLPVAVASVKDPSPTPYRRRDPAPPASPAAGDAPCRFPAAEKDPLSPESISLSHRAAAEVPAGQLTIFYGGRVNVYDDVPPDKARAIMQLAASRGFDDALAEPGPSSLSLPCRFAPGCLGPALVPAAAPVAGTFPAATPGKLPSPFRESASEWRAPRETETEGPTSRKASLQRYLEKRKDRFKGKRVIGVSSPSIMEMMYLGQKSRGQITNEQSSRSDMSSPTQPRPPCTPTRCSSIENKVPKFGISIDLNEEGIEEP